MTKCNDYLRRLVGLMGMTALCWFMMTAHCAWSQTLKPTEYQVKAAFLFNIAKFVEWPERSFTGPEAPFIFGILGDDPFGNDIDAVKKRSINGRNVQVRRFKELQEVTNCNVLFISSSETVRIETILQRLGKTGMLLVSDINRFADRGGMINFVVQDNRVGFKINIDAVSRAGITIHSRVLNMAIIVHDESKGNEE